MRKIALSEESMLSPVEVEQVFGIPRGSLANMRWAKRGPRYFKVGIRRVLYRLVDVKEWVESSPVQTIDSRPRV